MQGRGADDDSMSPVEGALKRIRRCCALPPRSMLRPVLRMPRILLMLLVLMPLAAPLTTVADPACEDESGACTPDEEHAGACASCVCCLTRLATAAPDVQSTSVDLPRVEAWVAVAATPPSPPPTEIPHVPKPFAV